MPQIIRRVKSGISGLDEILGGGLLKPSSVLLFGSIGTNKNLISQQFLWEGLKDDEPAIYVLVDLSPNDVLENMLRMGWDIRPYLKSGKMALLDGFSGRVGLETSATYVLEHPFDIDNLLKTLIIAEKEVFREGGGRLVFNHLTTVMFMLRKEENFKLIERLHGDARKYDGVFMFTGTRGLLDASMENFLKQLPDTVINLEKEWKGDLPSRYLRIDRCIKTTYPKVRVKYLLTEKGIAIERESGDR